MKDAVGVRGLGVSYGKRQVLRDMSFSVREGEFFIIIGPNGSGKSTLVRAIAGIVGPGTGEILIRGRPLGDYSRRALAKAVSVVPQSQPADIPFTVEETVLLGRSPYLSLLGTEKRRDRDIARAAMEFTGVSGLGRFRFDRLSMGERQRVLIARAICQKTPVIVLDEPTASLDLAHQLHIMELLKRLSAEEGTTVIMVSHDLNLAAMYAGRLLLVKRGELMAVGTPCEVLRYELLERTYGCVLLVDRNPVKDVPRITLVPRGALTG